MHVYKVEENMEFSELLHLCLFALDSVIKWFNPIGMWLL